MHDHASRSTPAGVVSPLVRVGALAAVLVWVAAPEAASGGARQALSLWWTTLVPALFPFLAAGELYLWGTQGMPIRPAGPLTRRIEALLGLPRRAWPPLLAGLIGGYPVGSALADRWVSQGLLGREEGARLTALASAPDPLFVAALWAPAFSHAPLLGPLLLAVQYLALIPVAALVRPAVTASQGHPAPLQSHLAGRASDPLGYGAGQAAQSLVVLAVVLTFVGATTSAVTALVPGLHLADMAPWLRDLVRALADGLYVAEGHGGLPLPWLLALTSALASFGGLAVWAETWALTRRSRLDLGPFARARAVQAVTSGLVAFVTAHWLWRRIVPGVPVLASLPDGSALRWHVTAAAALFGSLLIAKTRRRARPSVGSGGQGRF